MKNLKEEAVSEVGKNFLRPIGIAQGVFVLILIASPFVWIWYDWSKAWKFGLTGIIGVFFMYFIYKFIHKVISRSYDEVIDEIINEVKKESKSNTKSRFQERLERMESERKEKQNK